MKKWSKKQVEKWREKDRKLWEGRAVNAQEQEDARLSKERKRK